MNAAARVRCVLMTADAAGGVWQYSVALARHLTARGVKVALATMGPAPSREQRRMADGVFGLELFSSGYRLEWMDDPWQDVDAAGAWLLELAERVRPEVVHVNGYAHAAVAFGAPVVAVAHSCVATWWRAVHGSTPPERFDEYRRRVRAGLDAARVVVAPTRAMLTALTACHGEPGDARVIENGIDSPPSPWPPSDRRPVFFAAGRVWDEGKNLGVLLTAAPHLPWPVRIAGETRGPERPAVDLEHAALLGPLGESALQKELREAAVFVHPALYEPFGLAPLEAGASGCALVLADIPSLRELWSGAALFVAPKDRAAWGRALSLVARDTELRRALAEAARTRARRYEAARAAARYISLYEEVAGCAGTRAGSKELSTGPAERSAP